MRLIDTSRCFEDVLEKKLSISFHSCSLCMPSVLKDLTTIAESELSFRSQLCSKKRQEDPVIFSL